MKTIIGNKTYIKEIFRSPSGWYCLHKGKRVYLTQRTDGIFEEMEQ